MSTIKFDLLAEGLLDEAQGFDPETGAPTLPGSSWDASLTAAWTPTGEHLSEALHLIDRARGNLTLLDEQHPEPGVSDIEIEDLTAMGMTVDTGHSIMGPDFEVGYSIVDGDKVFNASDVQQVLTPDAWLEATTCTVWEEVHGKRRPVRTRRLADIDLREQLERVSLPDAEDHRADQWDQVAYEARILWERDDEVLASFPKVPADADLMDDGIPTSEWYAWCHLLTMQVGQAVAALDRREGRRSQRPYKVGIDDPRREELRNHWRRQNLGHRRSPKAYEGAKDPIRFPSYNAAGKPIMVDRNAWRHAVEQRDRADALAEKGPLGESVLDTDPRTGAERKAARWLADEQLRGRAPLPRLLAAHRRLVYLNADPMLVARSWRLVLRAWGKRNTASRPQTAMPMLHLGLDW